MIFRTIPRKKYIKLMNILILIQPQFPDLISLNWINMMPCHLQYSRGCPYNCDFCNVTALFGHNPRIKSTEHILQELDALYEAGWRRNIFFVDDNFIGNKRVIKDEVLAGLDRLEEG